MFLLFIEIMYCRSNVILSIQWDMYSTIFKLSLYIICKIHFISAAVNESMSRGSYRRFGRLEAEAEWRCKTTCGGAPAVHPPPLYSLSVAGGRQAGKRRETTLWTPGEVNGPLLPAAKIETSLNFWRAHTNTMENGGKMRKNETSRPR